jgi:hypothetical protein
MNLKKKFSSAKAAQTESVCAAQKIKRKLVVEIERR